MNIFVTGGAGFIASNFIRHLLRTRKDVRICNFDALTYAGNLENLADVGEDARYRFVKGDVANPEQVRSTLSSDTDVVVHFAAESHVDRSILDSSAFVRTNVQGTQVLLETARKVGAGRFVQISTDEVYGSLGPQGSFHEDSPLAPNSPYAASKAAADLLVRAYHRTFKMDTVITRCSNNYGPFQFPEKLIPLMILNALEDKPLPVYGDGRQVRDWIHVEDHCRAIERVVLEGTPGGLYNIGGQHELENIEVVRLILGILGKSEDLIRFVDDRPGHDRRYSIDTRRLREDLNWQPLVPFQEGLKGTVCWYQDHPKWVQRVRSGTYQNYYRKMYMERDRTISNI